MGLKNGVAIFQRVIEYCLEGVRDVSDPYVDDIIVGTEWQGSWEATVEQHEKDLRRVMGALEKTQMVVHRKKCNFSVKEVEFCGHILGNGQRRTAPGKLMALEKWEEHRTVTALRGFLGFTNYYSVYVPGYAELAAVLRYKAKIKKRCLERKQSQCGLWARRKGSLQGDQGATGGGIAAADRKARSPLHSECGRQRTGGGCGP